MNAYDILICIPYFFFLITKAQPVLGKILPPFKPMNSHVPLDNEVDDFDGWDSYNGIHKKGVIGALLLALLLSGAVVGISFFLKQFFPADYQTAGMILCITALVHSVIPDPCR